MRFVYVYLCVFVLGVLHYLIMVGTTVCYATV
jgi:hypothetical protein